MPALDRSRALDHIVVALFENRPLPVFRLVGRLTVSQLSRTGQACRGYRSG